MKTEDSLKKHVRFTCLNERPVSCHICEKPFIDNKSVRIHVQSVHMKEKPHLCPSCGKGFGTPISLKSHRENVHEKLKKYTCKVCGKTFGNQGNLYVHNQRHHERYVLAQFFTTLISLINVKSRLLILKKNPPSTFIDFLDFSTLHSSFIKVMY